MYLYDSARDSIKYQGGVTPTKTQSKKLRKTPLLFVNVLQKVSRNCTDVCPAVCPGGTWNTNFRISTILPKSKPLGSLPQPNQCTMKFSWTDQGRPRKIFRIVDVPIEHKPELLVSGTTPLVFRLSSSEL
jgi:hypothetical protein